MRLFYSLRSYVHSCYGKVSLRVLIILLSFVLMLERTLRAALTKKRKQEK